jgi:hypothetical protein
MKYCTFFSTSHWDRRWNVFSAMYFPVWLFVILFTSQFHVVHRENRHVPDEIKNSTVDLALFVPNGNDAKVR